MEGTADSVALSVLEWMAVPGRNALTDEYSDCNDESCFRAWDECGVSYLAALQLSMPARL